MRRRGVVRSHDRRGGDWLRWETVGARLDERGRRLFAAVEGERWSLRLVEVRRLNRWMAATLDGMIADPDAVFEAKFMLPWSFSEEAAAEKHMAQLQHNMWVTNARSAALSIITGGGKWVEMTIPADALYQHISNREAILAVRSDR